MSQNLRPTLALSVRFGHKMNASKAKDNSMISQAPETRIVHTWRVACDGGEGALGHPRVWLQIPQDNGWVECGYCDCKFIHQDFEGKV